MSDIVTNVICVISFLIEGYLACVLFEPFVEQRFRLRFGKYAASIVWFVLFTAMFILFNNTSEFALLIKLGVYISVMTAFSLIWYKGSFLRRVFPAVLYIAITELSVQCTNCLMWLDQPPIDIFTKLVLDGVIPYEYHLPIITIIIDVFIVLIYALRMLLIYFVTKQVVKSCKNGIEYEKETAVYMLPPVLGILISAMLRIIMLTLNDGYTEIIYYRYPALYAIVPAICLTLIFAIILNFKLYRSVSDMKRSEAEKMMLESQMLQLQTSLEDTRRLYDSISAVRHDMKNNLTVLQGLLNEKCPDDNEINRYFSDLSLSVGQLESRVNTGSAVCDAIISGKLRLAEKKIPYISVDAEDFMFSGVRIKPFDIGIILNNALDNAIEACERLSVDDKPYIRLLSFRKRNMFFIEVENSFDGIVRSDGKSALPLTRKEDASRHGIGLRNVREVTERYLGTMDIKTDGNVFRLTVMLQQMKE